MNHKRHPIHTEAYGAYKKECTDLWNFAAMICYAVPTLSKNIKGVEENIANYSMVKPDFFRYDNCNIDELKLRIKQYQKKLSSYLWLSNFSYFEAYIKRVLGELIEFHGGKRTFQNNTFRRIKKDTSIVDEETWKHRIKLQKPFDPRKIDQYKKKTKLLKEAKYVFPSEILAAYGVKRLIASVEDLRAKDVMSLLEDALLFNVDKEMKEKYSGYREKRNNIAHGKRTRMTMRETKQMFDYFRDLSYKVDQHLMNHFFVHERYVSDV